MRRLVLGVVGLASVSVLSANAVPSPGPIKVSIVDNAFVRDVQRPRVTIARGDTITWLWRSRQSHGVTVESGPARFAVAERTRGRVTRRFAKAGTYRLVCPLHAPGMKMTVVVRR